MLGICFTRISTTIEWILKFFFTLHKIYISMHTKWKYFQSICNVITIPHHQIKKDQSWAPYNVACTLDPRQQRSVISVHTVHCYTASTLPITLQAHCSYASLPVEQCTCSDRQCICIVVLMVHLSSYTTTPFPDQGRYSHSMTLIPESKMKPFQAWWNRN